MDVKFGFCGFSPFTAEDKKKRIQSRTSALIRKTGIRVCGSHRYLHHSPTSPVDSAASPSAGITSKMIFKEKLRKPFFYALETEGQLTDCLLHFFSPYGEMGEHKEGATVINPIIQRDGSEDALMRIQRTLYRTEELIQLFTETKEGKLILEKMAFVSCSFLLIYNSASVPDGVASGTVQLLLIDFARCGTRRLNYNEEENGFVYGLQEFAKCLRGIQQYYH